MENNIMQVERVLPADFDGTFRFTNWTDEDFVGVWGKKEYHFPAKTTSPMVMINETPLGIQQIRKKFAFNLAEREYFKSQDYKRLLAQERTPEGTPRINSIHQAGTYSIDQLASNIQKCLIPLEVGKVVVSEAKDKFNLEDKLTRDEEGEFNTIAVPEKGNLIESRKLLKRKQLG